MTFTSTRNDPRPPAVAPAEASPVITWCPTADLRPGFYIAKVGEREVAVLEVGSGPGFRIASCVGTVIGEFTDFAQGQAAVMSWLIEGDETQAS